VFRCSGVQVFGAGKVKDEFVLIEPEHLNT
jgi:hypothetical protein